MSGTHVPDVFMFSQIVGIVRGSITPTAARVLCGSILVTRAGSRGGPAEHQVLQRVFQHVADHGVRRYCAPVVVTASKAAGDIDAYGFAVGEDSDEDGDDNDVLQETITAQASAADGAARTTAALPGGSAAPTVRHGGSKVSEVTAPPKHVSSGQDDGSTALHAARVIAA
ncbi:hypothetical protein CYMTET_26820 [Cymbomonas tetramitiformis]|uniref:Uncharacterized protein n=1 Tax=Cymbomonas tetramitiformis TaxID=36881 RepID=A0AAE0KXV5_9CHLO|nr:hypothetical protein CYMTET_26820 [Cymbomonas tetramitiformis]